MDFPKAERHRGAKQHAHDVPYDAVPCSSIGARMSFDGDISAGAMMPTFKGMQTLTFGDRSSNYTRRQVRQTTNTGVDARTENTLSW